MTSIKGQIGAVVLALQVATTTRSLADMLRATGVNAEVDVHGEVIVWRDTEDGRDHARLERAGMGWRAQAPGLCDSLTDTEAIAAVIAGLGRRV